MDYCQICRREIMTESGLVCPDCQEQAEALQAWERRTKEDNQKIRVIEVLILGLVACGIAALVFADDIIRAVAGLEL